MDDSNAALEQALMAASRAPSRPASTNLPALDAAEAYGVQRRIAARAQMPIMVWKLGLTNEGAQRAFGASEPVVGRLPASAIYSDRSEVFFSGNEMFAEAELVFELGQDIPFKRTPYTREDVCAALKGIYAGIELVRTRFESSELPLELLIADNVMAHGLVLGRKLAATWEDRFADLPVTLTRNADPAVQGSTARVMGNPLDAVVWLANWLRDNEGSNLKREQLIAAGTCTGATEVSSGDTISIGFDGVECARVALCARN